MKTLFLTGLMAFILTGCGGGDLGESSGKEKEQKKHLNIDGGTETIDYKVVVIDGNEYFACRTYKGYWVLCPKLPPKSN